MNNKYQQYIRYFFIPVFLSIPFGVANYIFLKNNGELDSIEEVVNKQANNNGLYGTAIHHNVYAYKLELYKRYKPEIVVIGSSRVLQFRKNHFKKTMVNLGRTINYPLEAVKLVDDILKINKPKLILFGVDYWWGNPRWPHAYNFDTHNIQGGNLTPQSLLAPFKWLMEGKFPIDFYLDSVIGNRKPVNKTYELLGLQASLYGNGFSSDGSYYYQGTIYGRQPAEDKEFSNTLMRIKLDAAQFKYGDTLDVNRIKQLKLVLDRLKENGIKVLTFMPPLAPRIYSSVKKNKLKYSYIQKFRDEMFEVSDKHYDFTNPDSLDSNDCEFIDGFHGGDVVAARMLSRIIKDEYIDINNFFDVKKINEIIKNYSGHATSDNFYRANINKEIDYLGIGCNK